MTITDNLKPLTRRMNVYLDAIRLISRGAGFPFIAVVGRKSQSQQKTTTRTTTNGGLLVVRTGENAAVLYLFVLIDSSKFANK